MSFLRFVLWLIIAVMAGELVVLLAGDAARRDRFMPTVLAGLFIVVAWNAAIVGGAMWVVLMLLAAGGVMHAFDVIRRW